MSLLCNIFLFFLCLITLNLSAQANELFGKLASQKLTDCTITEASFDRRDIIGGGQDNWNKKLIGAKLVTDNTHSWLKYIKLQEWDRQGELHLVFKTKSGSIELLQFTYGAPRIYAANDKKVMLGPFHPQEQILFLKAELVSSEEKVVNRVLIDVQSRWAKHHEIYKPYMRWLANVCNDSQSTALSKLGSDICGIFPSSDDYSQYVEQDFNDTYGWQGKLKISCNF